MNSTNLMEAIPYILPDEFHLIAQAVKTPHHEHDKK
jgi:hypothetical protein